MRDNHADYSGENHPRSRKIICGITGKIYGCIKDAADDNGINYNTLYYYLTRNLKKTSLRYV
jgi:hypothetical protein